MNGVIVAARAALRTFTQMVFARWPRARAFFGSLPDERNYAGIVGDGRGSTLLMSCVSWVVNAFTQMRPIVVRLEDDDELAAQQVVGHVMAKLFRRPTFDPAIGRSHYGWMTMIAGAILSYIVDGNGYLVKVRGAGGAGRPVQLWYTPHWMMNPIGNPDDPNSFIAYYDYCPDGTTHYPLRVEDVIHLRDGLDPDNPRKGLSKVKILLREIYTDEEAARWTASLLRNHALPGIVISPKSPLENPDDAKEVKARLNSEFGADRRGTGLVLAGPADIFQYGFSPEQMKLGDIRDIPEERISAAVGIPAAVVGFGAGLQSTKVGATMAELVDLAWQNGVMPRATVIAAEITEQLLTEFEPDAGEGIEFIFDMSKVPIMADFRNKEAQTLELLMRWSVIRRGEARKRLGLKSGVRDDVYVLSSGLTEVDALKSIEDAPAVKPIAETAPVAAVPGEGAPALAPPDPTPALGPGQGAKALTPREQEIAVLMPLLTNKAIADRLVISERTVETHVANVMSKLGVHARGDVAEEKQREELTVVIERLGAMFMDAIHARPQTIVMNVPPTRIEQPLQLKIDAPTAAPVPSEVHLHVGKVVDKIEMHVDPGAVQSHTEIAKGAVQVGVMPPAADIEIIRDAEGRVSGTRRASTGN